MADDDFEPEQVVEQLKKVLSLVETNLKRLKASMGPKGSDRELDKDHIFATEKLASTALDLSRESRAWFKTSREMGKKLSLQDKLELCAAFVQKLSPSDRRDFDLLLGKRGSL